MKVKVTNEQAKMIEYFKKIVNRLGISADAMLYAVENGYEVEPEFKVGDKVIVSFSDIGKKLCEVVENKESKEVVYVHTGDHVTYVPPTIVRHATPSEIAEEKERRFWKKHGRDVWELKAGDLLKRKNNSRLIEIGKDAKVSYENGHISISDPNDPYYSSGFKIEDYKVICFAENRLDQ